MTTSVSESLLKFLYSTRFVATSNSIAIACILLLVFLLIQREVLRNVRTVDSKRSQLLIDMMAIPVAVLILVIILLRFAYLANSAS